MYCGIIFKMNTLKGIKMATDCTRLFNCCDCGGSNCGCTGCWSCNHCESCEEYENDGINPDCENANWNE